MQIPKLSIIIAESANSRSESPLQIKDHHARTTHARSSSIGDEYQPIARYLHVLRSAETRRPLGEKIPRGIKDLNAPVIPIQDVHSSAAVERQGVRQVELCRAGTLFPPLSLEAAVLIELCDAIVAVTVADVDRTVRGNRDVARLIEMRRVLAWHASLPQGHQQPAGRAVLEDLMPRDVGDP